MIVARMMPRTKPCEIIQRMDPSQSGTQRAHVSSEPAGCAQYFMQYPDVRAGHNSGKLGGRKHNSSTHLDLRYLFKTNPNDPVAGKLILQSDRQPQQARAVRVTEAVRDALPRIARV